MTPFLKQVAQHYLQDPDIEKTVFIFPNRRSLAFFRKYLGEAVASYAGKGERTVPLLEPETLTISDFFCKVMGRYSSDRITLLTRLYDCYSSLNPAAEPLDDFIYWGDALLGDFDDVDKQLVRAEGLFGNIADLKEIRDDYSYLSEEQLGAIRRLASHFTPGEWKRSRGGNDVKAGFLQIWELLYPLYTRFREMLEKERLAYEGMIFRNFAERLGSESIADILEERFGKNGGFVFVGLNALSESERRVLRRMKDADLAEFCWDFPGKMIADPSNAASHFMDTMQNANLKLFGNAFTASGGEGKPKVHVVAVPSATGQAKLLKQTIESVPEEQRGLDFAVVLPDESMLMPVLNSIPESIGHINVTMGYPLSSSEFYALMREISTLQMHLRCKEGKWFLYSRQVLSILSSGIVKSIMTEDEAEAAAKIRQGAKFYIPEEDFGDAGLLQLIFRPVAKSLSVADAVQTDAIADYLLELTHCIACRLPRKDSLQLEYARQYYCSINALKQKHLCLMPQTWFHLAAQICAGQSVPFDGDPLGGLQIMGPLETRALDFRHMVIMSCSEGVFPRRSVSTSFIPPELRKAFGLPTYEYQDAVWAYYFYRMIARAENVWMFYDSRTEGLKCGEESRYIKQLRFLYGDCIELDEYVAKAPAGSRSTAEAIEKTAGDIELIRKGTYSASLLQKYLDCPAKFYYYFIKKLRPAQEASENLDKGTLGNVCHDTLMAIYCGGEAFSSEEDFDKRKDGDLIAEPFTIDSAWLEGWLAREDEIRDKIHSVIRNKLHTVEVTGKNLIDAQIALRYVLKVLKRDLELVRERGPITLIGVEKQYPPISICGHRFTGFIDRLDSFGEGNVRISDYKTGKDSPDTISENNIAKAVDALFERRAGDHKAALQFYIYHKILAADSRFDGRERLSSMYAISDIFSNPVALHALPEGFMEGVEEHIANLFREMEDPLAGFRRTDDTNKCSYCDYCPLCGRNPGQ